MSSRKTTAPFGRRSLDAAAQACRIARLPPTSVPAAAPRRDDRAHVRIERPPELADPPRIGPGEVPRAGEERAPVRHAIPLFEPSDPGESRLAIEGPRRGDDGDPIAGPERRGEDHL